MEEAKVAPLINGQYEIIADKGTINGKLSRIVKRIADKAVFSFEAGTDVPSTNAILKEAAILKQFKHENILALVDDFPFE